MGSNCHGKTGRGRRGPPAARLGRDATPDSGELVADLVTAGERVLARQGRQRRLGQPALRDADAPGAALRQAGPARRGAPPRDRAEAPRRRRDHRVSQRRQVDAHLGDLGREAEDRRLPVHDARPAPRRRDLARRADARRGRHPGPDRGRPPRRGARHPVPEARRALPAALPSRRRLRRRATPSTTSRRSRGSSRASPRRSPRARACSSPPRCDAVSDPERLASIRARRRAPRACPISRSRPRRTRDCRSSSRTCSTRSRCPRSRRSSLHRLPRRRRLSSHAHRRLRRNLRPGPQRPRSARSRRRR